MSTPNTVEYDKFLSLNGRGLCHYMEALVNNPLTKIPKDVLQQMRNELSTYDEYHLVYAIELGAKHSPETYAMLLPQYLTYEQGAVWSAALRSLQQLPREFVTDALIDLVREVYCSHKGKSWIADALDSLEEKRESERDL